MPAAAFALTAWIGSRVPGQVQRRAWLPLGAWFAVLAALAWTESGPGFPPALLLLPPYVLIVAALSGFVAGSAAFVAAGALLLVYALTHPLASGREFALRANIAIALVLTQAFSLIFWLTFRRLQRTLEQRTALVSARISERTQLSQTFVSGFTEELTKMTPKLSFAQPGSAQALLEEHGSLARLLTAARDSLRPRDDQRDDDGWQHALPHFRTQTMRLLLWGSILNLVSILLRVHLTGVGAVLPTWVIFGWNVLLLVLFERKLVSRSTIALAMAVASLGVIAWAMRYWHFATPMPNVPFVMTTAFAIVSIGNRRLELVVVAGAFTVLMLPVLFGGVSTAEARQFWVDAALGTALMIVGWYQLEGLTNAVLRTLRWRAEELSRLEKFRTRICGMLFHDVANPLHTLGMLLGIGDDLDASERDQVARLHARLAGLVRVVGKVLAHDDPLRNVEIGSVPVQALFRDMEELFAFRLREKSQSLVCKPAPLDVRASPELLRDSVVANLLSNAIKFAPAETEIELSARRSGDAVEIVVRDHGPGWPREVLERLDRGEKIASTPGTKGETGLGLGLTLVREHVTRMEGKLSLQEAPGGGSEAVVRLPLAS